MPRESYESIDIDFFSWHSYAKVEKTLVIDRFIHQRLTEYGYGSFERHLNEWNNAHSMVWYGKSYASAANAAMMCAMQNSRTDMLCYYDAKLAAGNYSGFFAPFTRELTCTYYVFAAFGELYTLKNQVLCEMSEEQEGFYALAATDGDRSALMIVNHSEESRQLSLDLDESFSVYLLDQDHYLTRTDASASRLPVKANQILLIKNYESETESE